MAQAGGDLDVHQRINLALNNFVVGVGYNYSEVQEERLERLNRSSFFIRLRAKFDQNVWNIFDGLN